MKRALLAGGLVALLAVPARGQTRLEGEYFFLVDIRKQDRFFAWDFDSNNDDTFNQLELRLLSSPFPGVEMFLKTGAEWNRGSNNNARPRLQFREAHIKFRREFGARGFESYLFSRQSRFWVDNQLIQAVWDVTGGNGQGVRLDTWGFLGLHTAAIYSDFSGVCLNQSRSPFGATRCDPDRSAETDDGYILRSWRAFLDDKLRVGFTYNRKNERETGDRAQEFQFTEVYAADMRLTLFDVDYRFEIARGRDNTLTGRVHERELAENALEWRPSKFSFADPQAAFPDDIVVKAEARAFRFGSAAVGFFNVAPTVWLLGPQFRNQLGDSNNDEKGYAINTWYLVPARAITLTTNSVQLEKEVFQQRKVSEFYGEMFTEYVNGFTTKFSYRRRRTSDFFPDTEETRVTKNDDLFGELIVENRLAWLQVQGLIKDLSTPFKKELLSIATSINVTDKVKIYNRYMFGNDPGRQRKGLFTELQYRPTDSVDLFIAYGPFWMGGGSNPVFEGNLQGSGDHRDLLRMFVRGNF
ncbi:MAG: hypothetical protein ACE5G2_01945 [Candidatus Krumholzibacteriia bacterium]